MTADLLTILTINIGIIIVKAALILGLVVLFDRVMWPTVDFSEQIRQGNMAAAMFFGLVVLAIVLGSSLGR